MDDEIQSDSPDWLLDRIHEFADRPFLVRQGNTYTYSDLHDKVCLYSESLQRKEIPAGTIVGLHADFQLESIAAFIALMKHEAIITPVVDGLPKQQVLDRWNECNAQWIWKFDDTQDQLNPTVGSDPNHPLIENIINQNAAGIILFSSGSVGKPKAMVLNANKLLKTFRQRKARKLRLLSFLLFDHIGGINTMLNAIACGMQLVVPESRNPDVVASLIESEKVNLLPTSPTFLNLLMMSGAIEKYDLSSLKFVTYGTEPMPIGLLTRLKDAFPNSRFLQTFGTSETGIAKTSSRSSSSNLIKFDDENLEHKIVDGELWLRSTTQIQGYLNHDNKRFRDDGWFQTGDMVEMAEDGYFHIIGRREEVINVGGEKVAPSEVEGVLMQVDAVVDCLVYGEPNSITGSTVVADIVLQNDTDAADVRRQARRLCRKKLEPYKMPTRFRLVSHTDFSERFKKVRRGAEDEN